MELQTIHTEEDYDVLADANTPNETTELVIHWHKGDDKRSLRLTGTACMGIVNTMVECGPGETIRNVFEDPEFFAAVLDTEGAQQLEVV